MIHSRVDRSEPLLQAQFFGARRRFARPALFDCKRSLNGCNDRIQNVDVLEESAQAPWMAQQSSLPSRPQGRTWRITAFFDFKHSVRYRQRHSHQKLNFNANWITRGATIVLVI